MTPNTHPVPGRRAHGGAAPRLDAAGAALRRRRPARAHRALALGLAVLATAGCDQVDRLLSIETPSRLPESSLLVPTNAALLVASAAGDFQCAYGAYTVASGLAGGELTDATETAARWSYDRRAVLPVEAFYASGSCEGIGVYTPINTARYTNDQILQKLQEWTDEEVPDRQRLIAQAAAFSGYSLLLLGEGFCSGAIAGGPEITSAQILDSAEVRFTQAIETAQAIGATDLLNLARVGRARARLDNGDLAGAASDAEAVPVDFVYDLESTDVASRYYNRVAAQNITGNAVTVAAAYRNLTVQGEPDPRVPVVDADQTAGDDVTPLWRQQKYPELTSPMRLASGVEAQLILAEARGGAEGVAILNALRARAGVELPPLTPAEEADFTGTLFRERARELFLQGTRWYDLRRGDLPLVPAPGTPYPKGGNYGEQRCWPLPDVERLSNPNIPDQG
ncbi:MAG TPA: RagB/SusD family nutrient uptake outer membrane protein [Gemmatimonadaceae bacterium]|nr:RagB/SusD family nutrient uptake outer membrane protein [Gemmatimonadaceae bacterium]